ncbi:MAG: universal stress protein [candidate division NC10 bacterium]|nr:universal stress protein [candidate division NC10 bacterium]
MAIHEILFPTDFSEAAHYAGRYAAALARKLGASLHILHVPLIPLPPTSIELTGLALAELYEAGRLKAEARLQGLCQEEEFRGLSVRTTVRAGLVEDEILNAAEGSDLIIMGTHGRIGLARTLLGSVTEKVARTAPCPVLAVKHPEVNVELPWGRVLAGRRKAKEGLELQKVLVPLDGSTLAEGILPQVKELARPLGAQIVLVWVVVPPPSPGGGPADHERRAVDEAGAYLQAKRRELQAEGFKVEEVVREGDAAEKIIEYAEESDAGLIAMATHGRSGLGRWLLGSVAEKVLRGSDVPVLLYRAWTPSK